MKPKTPNEFLTFNDGIIEIIREGSRERIRLHYGNRVVGIKRHYAARTAGTEISKLIHVPVSYTHLIVWILHRFADGM